jgi:PEGA domain/Short C-terminal domain
MKSARWILGCALVSLLAGCGGSVLIRTAPPGAKAYVDGNFIGRTPVEFSVPRREIRPHALRLEKEGFEPIEDTIRTRVAPGRIVGAIFSLGIVYLFRSPMDLVTPEMYALSPALSAERDRAIGEALRRVQELHDQGKISDEEFKRQRDEILNSNH